MNYKSKYYRKYVQLLELVMQSPHFSVCPRCKGSPKFVENVPDGPSPCNECHGVGFLLIKEDD